MFSGPGKPLDKMTNREIISTLVAFILGCGIIITACVLKTVKRGGLLLTIWNGAIAIFAAALLSITIPPAIRELWRRKHKKPNQDHGPAA